VVAPHRARADQADAELGGTAQRQVPSRSYDTAVRSCLASSVQGANCGNASPFVRRDVPTGSCIEPRRPVRRSFNSSRLRPARGNSNDVRYRERSGRKDRFEPRAQCNAGLRHATARLRCSELSTQNASATQLRP
jgi:hypothetical protein